MADNATRDMVKTLRKTFVVLLVVVAFCSAVMFGVLNRAGISFFAISGDSMNPFFKDGDSVVLKQENTIRKGQIIFLKKPSAWSEYSFKDKTLVKRVVAVPGDTITYDGSTIKVNNDVFYDVKGEGYECSVKVVGYSHTLSSGEVFVAGDNAKESLDSRRIFCDGHPDEAYVPKNFVKDFGHVIFKF